MTENINFSSQICYFALHKDAVEDIFDKHQTFKDKFPYSLPELIWGGWEKRVCDITFNITLDFRLDIRSKRIPPVYKFMAQSIIMNIPNNLPEIIRDPLIVIDKKMFALGQISDCAPTSIILGNLVHSGGIIMTG